MRNFHWLSCHLVAVVTAILLSCTVATCADDDAELTELFVVPDGSFEELRDYATRLREEWIKRNREVSEKYTTNSLTPDDQTAIMKFQAKYDETRAEVLRKIAALPNPGKEAKVYVASEKWNVARYILLLPERVKEIKKVLDECENDPDLVDIRKEIKADWFLFAFMNENNPLNLAGLYVEFIDFLKEDTDHAVYCCDELLQKLIELRPEITEEEIEQVLEPIIAILEASQDEEIRSFIDKLAGVVRFYMLPGREMELKGTLLDGTLLDLKTCEGKVVYIDFWATWCGPCIGEMPELHGKYLALKDAGFEVISYSIDEDMDALTAFQEKTGYTWPTISVLKSRENGLPDYFEYYGGGAVPKTVLIGRDGKVIKTDVRGQQLSMELDKLFADEIEKKINDPNVPFAFKLDYHHNKLMQGGLVAVSSESYCEQLENFIIENKDEDDYRLGNLCTGLVGMLQFKEKNPQVYLSSMGLPPIPNASGVLSPEDSLYHSVAVAKRLLPHLQESKSMWLRKSAETLESIIRSSEMFGKEMEFEALRMDGTPVNIKDFRGKPVVIAMHHFNTGFPLEYQFNSFIPMQNQLREYEAKYFARDLQLIAYYVGDQKYFPEPDESMKNWIITDGEAAIKQGMKNYIQYYGAGGSPQWFLIDRDGLAVETDTNFGKSLEQFFAE